MRVLSLSTSSLRDFLWQSFPLLYFESLLSLPSRDSLLSRLLPLLLLLLLLPISFLKRERELSVDEDNDDEQEEFDEDVVEDDSTVQAVGMEVWY